MIIAALIFGFSKFSSAQSTVRSNKELIIKTVVAKGSVRSNEFGEHSDWLEIYNTTNNAIDLSEEAYFISDDPKRKRKFKLKKGIVPPKSSVVVWCDDEGRFKKQIHANFKLSSLGETLTITKVVDRQPIIVDEVTYEALNENGQRALIRHKNELRLLPISGMEEEFGCLSSH